MAFLSVFVVAIALLQKGRRQNDEYAENFSAVAIPFLMKEFSHLGCTSNGRSQAILQKSYSEYYYFASGRKNIVFAEFKMYLVRRFCLLTKFLYDPIRSTRDQLVIEIPIETGGKNIPLEFCICKKRVLKAKLEELPMIHNSNAKNYKPEDSADKNSFAILSEHDEISNQLVDERVGYIL